MTTVALLEADLLLVDEPTAEIDEEESGGERHQPALAWSGGVMERPGTSHFR